MRWLVQHQFDARADKIGAPEFDRGLRRADIDGFGQDQGIAGIDLQMAGLHGVGIMAGQAG